MAVRLAVDVQQEITALVRIGYHAKSLLSDNSGVGVKSELNRQWILAKRPDGLFSEKDFSYQEAIIRPLQNEQFLVEVFYVSLDPTQRLWAQMDTYLPAVEIGEVMRSLGMGVVVKSRNPAFQEGDIVQGMTGWQSHIVTDGRGFSQVPANSGLPLSAYMGPLGMTGITAYFGLLDIGKPEAGQTLIVSGAAGAVGSIACQIGKIKGMRVVGLAGSEEKCQWLEKELGIDVAVNYRNASVWQQLQDACPDGVDVVFENVGGKLLDMSLGLINVGARVALCGYIAGYTQEKNPGSHNLPMLISKRATMQGFLVLDYVHKSREALTDLGKWMMDGRLQYRMDIENGFKELPTIINKLFNGENKGKLVAQINKLPESS